jgi:DNA primase
MPGLVSPATLEQIRAASDIVEVIGATLPLKRAGANFVALCPFHKEKTPSFNVNPHKQIFHCFGCHKGGDVFTFIQEYEGLSFVEAVRRLAERAGIPLEFDSEAGQPKTRYLKESLLQIHEQITQRWHSALTHDAGGQIARQYLAQRGVSDEAVALFRLGYAPDAWDDTVNWAKNKNYELALVEKAGLILRKEGADHFYDRFRARLIFPVADEQGRIIAFSGRILAGDEKTAKYVNSPETPIFIKGKVFFGLDKSKRAILDAGFAIICEGQLDLIACYMAGVRNVVAPQGTALTADHARILKRYIDEVVLCFDSDDAGQIAAARVLDSLLASGLSIRVVNIPAPHDPDSFIKEFGGPAFQTLIDQARGFFDYYLARLCSTNDLGTDKGRLAVLTSMAEAVLKTGNQMVIDTYAQKTAQQLAVSADAVRAEFRKHGRTKPPAMSIDEGTTEEVAGQPRPSPVEFWLLKLLLLNDNHVDWVAGHLDLNWIQHPAVRAIVAERLELRARGNWRGVAALLTAREDPAARSLVTEAVTDSRAIPQPEKQLADYLVRLREQFINRQLVQLTQEISRPDRPDAERTLLLKQQQDLRQLKRQPLSPLAGSSPSSPSPQ